ncbi:MAG: glycosyltransferase family 2 protein [Verrucomicrobia bacterium]|nr:glycosyltransferase family 2 protein [Verrucomicrobiota bacterium]
MNEISVILCTHNPRDAYLKRVLQSLELQTLPKDRWEFIVVDNASSPALEQRLDLSWHPQARVLREEVAGITPARLCGLRAATADLVVIVDDDNVLSPDYLEQALAIAASRPSLGAWGGVLDAELEEPPAEWMLPHLELLAVRPAGREMWSNLYDSWLSTPSGAGMCLRRRVVDAYLATLASQPARLILGRSESSMIGSEDIDMAYHAIDIGMGCGRFPALRLTHLIPKERCARAYILRLVEGTAESQVYLDWFRSKGVLERIARLRADQVLRLRLRDMLDRGINGAIQIAKQRGRERAYRRLDAGELRLS